MNEIFKLPKLHFVLLLLVNFHDWNCYVQSTKTKIINIKTSGYKERYVSGMRNIENAMQFQKIEKIFRG